MEKDGKLQGNGDHSRVEQQEDEGRQRHAPLQEFTEGFKKPMLRKEDSASIKKHKPCRQKHLLPAGGKCPLDER